MDWPERKRRALPRRAHLRVVPRNPSEAQVSPGASQLVSTPSYEGSEGFEAAAPRIDRLALFAGSIAAGVTILGLAIPMQVSRLGGPAPWSWGPWLGPYAGSLGLGLGLLFGLTWGMELERRWFWAGFGAPLAMGAAWASGLLAFGGTYGW